MLGKLGYLALGVGTGAIAHKTYRHYNPVNNISMSSKEMIDSYVAERKLEEGYLVSILKALGVVSKGFYCYGMGIKLEGFNFNTTYLLQSQVNDDHNINHIFCIFSPTQFICGHPEIQHGGATATIIDNTFGYLAILHAKHNIATASLTLNYKRPVKKDQLYVFEGKVDKREGRKIFVSGVVKELETGEVKVETSALFMTVNWDNQISRILKKFFEFEEKIHPQPQDPTKA